MLFLDLPWHSRKLIIKNTMHISVVIPLYNKRDSIIRALDSVFKQTVLPDEVIIVNDGSTDGSDKMVELLNHSMVRLIHQKNAGVSAARNRGIDSAKNEWIAFLDADDVWKPDYLKEIFDLAQSYPGCSVLATAYELEDSSGNRTPILLNKIPFEGNNGKLSNYFEVAACSHPPLCSSAIVLKKSALQIVGGFPLGIKSGEDLLTWARLAVRFEIAYSLMNLAVFILDESHEISQKPTRLHDENDIVGKALINLYQKYSNKSLKVYISHWYKMRVSVYFRLNNKKNVFKFSMKALYYNIFNFKIYLFMVLVLLPNSLQTKIKQLHQ